MITRRKTSHVRTTSEQAREALLEEIDNLIAEAAEASTIVKAGSLAKALLDAFPRAGFSGRGIADAIIQAAAGAKVPVEVDSFE
jgi:hypothetical protein